ncbi:helix-turn-helix domain-containing protein, partial [Mycobacterium tuberculosis]|nr:helix-turn-helix domain-containing protein [Mycobacterium tuberculosis]
MLNTDLIKGAAQAAEYAGITRRTIYHLVETQRIPCIRMGTRLY